MKLLFVIALLVVSFVAGVLCSGTDHKLDGSCTTAQAKSGHCAAVLSYSTAFAPVNAGLDAKIVNGKCKYECSDLNIKLDNVCKCKTGVFYGHASYGKCPDRHDANALDVKYAYDMCTAQACKCPPFQQFLVQVGRFLKGIFKGIQYMVKGALKGVGNLLARFFGKRKK